MDARLVRPVSDGGCGLDALWNDDFHHSAMVALTGRAEAYYGDTRGEPQELVSAAKYGSLFQGQYYHWQRRPRGTPALDLPPSRFVAYLQNHDQVANSARGLRGHQLTSPSKWRAMTAALLLMPATPMLFQGQEFNATSPFLYFADFDGELAAAVRAGRSEFLAQFSSVIHYQREAGLDDPAALSTFERCKLDFSERATNAAVYRLHRDLIRLRSETPVCDSAGRSGVDGAVLAARAFMLRFFGNRSIDDHVLIVNLGGDVRRQSFAEPLLAPPFGRQWGLRWSSEDPRYGGNGMPDLWPDRGWAIPAECAILLTSQVSSLKSEVLPT
jgi:maltooligosyltrehalose trehalohydrolase